MVQHTRSVLQRTLVHQARICIMYTVNIGCNSLAKDIPNKKWSRGEVLHHNSLAKYQIDVRDHVSKTTSLQSLTPCKLKVSKYLRLAALIFISWSRSSCFRTFLQMKVKRKNCSCYNKQCQNETEEETTLGV